MSFNFETCGYSDKVFVSFKDIFMTEGGPSLILGILKNFDQIPNKYLFKISNTETGLF